MKLMLPQKYHFEIRILVLFILIIPILICSGCDRPGGEDEEGRSYTYGMQISSVNDHEDGTSYIILDMSPENVGTDELADITIDNVIPSSGTDATINQYDETNSLHINAYKVDYHIKDFENVASYVGRLNILITAGGSQTFNILLMTGATKMDLLGSIGYDNQKGYLTFTFSGYDGNGNEKSRSIDVDAYVYTYLRETATPSETQTATATKTQTATPSATNTATPSATVTQTFF